MDAPQRQVRPSLRPARDLPAFPRRERNKALSLQAFWPWQELFADLQSLMPLQAFAPSQCTFAEVPPLPPMFAQPVMNRAAAVAASAIPASFLPSISGSPCGVMDECPGC